MSGRSVAIVALAAAFAVGACSSADLRQPIAGFKTATEATQASLTAYEEVLDAAAFEANAAYALANRSALRPDTGNCRLNAARCQLIVHVRDSTARRLGPEPIDPAIRRLMAGLVTYAGNLETIVNVDKEAELSTAADAAKGNLIALAKAADVLSATRGDTPTGFEEKVTSFASPVADGVVWLFGKYIDALKRSALREATGTMDRIMPDLTLLFGAVADAGATAKRNKLSEAYFAADLAYNVEPRTRAKLDALSAAAIALDAALVLDPKAMFVGLRDAHHELTVSLSRPDLSFETLWPLLQAIGSEAAKLHAIVSAIATAAKSPTAN